MIEPRGWEVLENLKNPICPLISALTVKQANKYIECVKEKCMWWSKCKGLEEQRPHGEWIEHRQYYMNYFVSKYECSNCHDEVWQNTEWQFCPHCGAYMRRKEGEADGV